MRQTVAGDAISGWVGSLLKQNQDLANNIGIPRKDKI